MLTRMQGIVGRCQQGLGGHLVAAECLGSVGKGQLCELPLKSDQWRLYAGRNAESGLFEVSRKLVCWLRLGLSMSAGASSGKLESGARSCVAWSSAGCGSAIDEVLSANVRPWCRRQSFAFEPQHWGPTFVWQSLRGESVGDDGIEEETEEEASVASRPRRDVGIALFVVSKHVVLFGIEAFQEWQDKLAAFLL